MKVRNGEVFQYCLDGPVFLNRSGKDVYVPDAIAVYRPVKRRTMNRKQAEEWLNRNSCWCSYNGGHYLAGRCGTELGAVSAPTFIDAVLALKKKLREGE